MTVAKRNTCSGCDKPEPLEWCWDGRQSGCPLGFPPRYAAPVSIACPQCGRVSYNPNDVREQYCGNCHQYHDTMRGRS